MSLCSRPRPNFFRLQKFDVLHGHFRYAVRTAMQFLLFPGQTREVERFFGDVLFRR